MGNSSDYTYTKGVIDTIKQIRFMIMSMINKTLPTNDFDAGQRQALKELDSKINLDDILKSLYEPDND